MARDSAAVDIPGAPTAEEFVAAVGTMKENPKDPAILEMSCNILSRRGYVDSNKDWILETDAIPLSIQAMRRFPDSKAVQHSCAAALAGISLFSFKTQTAAGEAGAVELVVDMIRRWPMDPHMQEFGMCGCFNDFQPLNRERFAKAGGWELAMAALRNHPSDEFVVVQVGYVTSSGTQEPNAQAFADVGGIEMTLAAMKAHAHESRVREEYIGGMQAVLRHSEDLRNRAVKAGWIPEILAAMRDSPMDMHLMTWSCIALHVLAEKNHTFRNMIAGAGATQLALDAVQNTPAMLEHLGSDGHPLYAETQYTVGKSCTRRAHTLS